MDASVCARWFLDEEYSDRARVLRDSFVKGIVTIAVPSLLFYETLNALRYSGEYREKELSLAATSLSKYGFEVWEPEGEVYRETARSSMKYDLTIYDASYTALAEHLRILLYTADDEILEKAPGRARHIKTVKE